MNAANKSISRLTTRLYLALFSWTIEKMKFGPIWQHLPVDTETIQNFTRYRG